MWKKFTFDRYKSKTEKNLREVGWSHNILFDCKWKKDTQQSKKLQVKGTTQATSENNASEWLGTVIHWNNVKKGMQIEEMQCWIIR